LEYNLGVGGPSGLATWAGAAWAKKKGKMLNSKLKDVAKIENRRRKSEKAVWRLKSAHYDTIKHNKTR
jgi:hypothetical protein